MKASSYASPSSRLAGAAEHGKLPISTPPPQSHIARNEQNKANELEKESNAVPTPAPAWTEMKTKAGKERKRLPLACKSCRRKKVRCSGETPACKHCLRAKIPCVYKVTQRKATPRTDYMTMLDKRLKRMEERVIRLVPSADTGKLSTIGRANVKPPSAERSKAGSKKRAAIEAFAQDKETPQNTSESKDTAEQSFLHEGKEYLPEKAIQEHLAETYFDSCYGQPYHLLHKPSFMRRLREGTIPAVLMLAICAISARFSNHPHFASEAPGARGEQWAAEARRLVSRTLAEPNLTTVIVVTMLALYDFGNCQGGRAWMHSGIAMRMSYALQLNQEYEQNTSGVERESGTRTVLRERDINESQGQGTIEKSPGMSFTDQEIRRRTMWSCYLMDCFNSSGTKRPIFDHLQHLRIQLPIKESYFQLEVPGRTECVDGETSTTHIPEDQDTARIPRENMGVAAYMVKTLVVWAKVIRFSNTFEMHNDKVPPWHPESEFTKLEAQVKQFGQNLPNFLRYTPENFRSHEAEKLGNQFAFMHIIYQQIILFLFKFTIPAFPNSRIPQEMPREYLQKRRLIALDSARNISKIIDDAKGVSLTAPFASYCAFVSSTVHIWGMYSKNPKLAESSKSNLSINVKYLSRMRKYWGMVHYMTESLKDVWKQHADAQKNLGASHPRKLSDDIFFGYGDIQERDRPEEIAEEQPQSPSSKSQSAELSSKSHSLSVGDWFQSKGQSPQLDSTDKPKRPLKKGKQSHSAKPSQLENVQSRLDAAPMVSRSPTPPDSAGAVFPSDVGMQHVSKGLATPTQPQFTPMSNPYQDRSLAASFTMSNIAGGRDTPYNRFPVQAFDRQLVYGAYAQDPSLPYNPTPFDTHPFNENASADIGMGMVNGALDPGLASQLGMDAASAANPESFGDASAAWLTPFHMVPPVNLVHPDFGSSNMEVYQGDPMMFSINNVNNDGGMNFWNM